LFDVFGDSAAPTAKAAPPAKRKPESQPGAKKPRKEAEPQEVEGARPTDAAVEVIYERLDGRGCVHEWIRPAGYEPRTAPEREPAKSFPYELDPFQKVAVNCIEKEESILVSAHTSAGKTSVAEYAIATALREKQRIIYTSPIKALSNQKYRDLSEEFQDVGLMTGDVTINPQSTCMIMTTEILRSMLYRGSELCREMAWVVFDEVHYMRDRDRGVVWEEVIILLPDTVRLVFLSATIPNTVEFAEWICRIKHQPCHICYTEYRPVPLQHYIFPAGGEGVYMVVDEKGEFKEDNFQRAVASLDKAVDNDKTQKKPKKRIESNLRGDLLKVVRMCADRHYLPVIVFAFSRRECESNAMAMKKMELTDADEQQLIEEVFQNAMATLGDDDRDLPQVQQMVSLLKRGIGIHHGGLLPILKEVIEILFQEGLLKVLFSTETFSMGVNMPAKTVVFTQIRKWDGKENRVLQSGEYIQMSGRAGRRGKDDRGLTIICLDQKVEQDEAKDLFLGASARIDSQFHLGYNMLLNLMRVEGANPDYMIQRSLHQFQKDKSASTLDDEKAILEKEVSQSASIATEEHGFDADAAIADYFHVKVQVMEQKAAAQKIIISPKWGTPFLTTGRLVHVIDKGEDWGWGILAQGTKRKFIERQDDETEVEWVVDVFLACAPGSHETGAPCPAEEDGEAEGQVITMAFNAINSISKIRANLPSADLRNADARKQLLNTLETIKSHPKMVDGVPELDPVKEMKIDDPKLMEHLSKMKELEESLKKNPLYGHPSLKSYEDQFGKRVAKLSRLKEVQAMIDNSKFLVMRDDLRSMRRVLKRLDFVDRTNVVQVKGRFACEISSCDELLLTEIVFQNVFEDMEPNHVLALCSCLVFDEKSEDPVTSETVLLKAFDKCQAIARSVGQVMHECKLPIDVEEYAAKFKPQLMAVTLGWLEGKKFSEIMGQCDLYEGSVVRAIRRLEELARELVIASKVIGNTELEKKMMEARSRLKRGIIFAASLYL